MHLVTLENKGIRISNSLFFLEQNAVRKIVELAIEHNLTGHHPWNDFSKLEEFSENDITKICINLMELSNGKGKEISWQEIEPLDTAEAESEAEDEEESDEV